MTNQPTGLWKRHPEFNYLWISQDMEVVRNATHTEALHSELSFCKPKGKLLITKQVVKECQDSGLTAVCTFHHYTKRTRKRVILHIPVKTLYLDAWSDYIAIQQKHKARHGKEIKTQTDRQTPAC